MGACVLAVVRYRSSAFMHAFLHCMSGFGGPFLHRVSGRGCALLDRVSGLLGARLGRIRRALAGGFEILTYLGECGPSQNGGKERDRKKSSLHAHWST